MGDKASARRLAKEAGVPTVPGSEGILSDPEEALRVADGIGFPVIIKATAGGGGKGMRIAHDADQFTALFSLARTRRCRPSGTATSTSRSYLARPRPRRAAGAGGHPRTGDPPAASATARSSGGTKS